LVALGAISNLFPALTLGSGSVGKGITSDNVSPMNLIYARKVGYGVRNIEEIINTNGLLTEEKSDLRGMAKQLDYNLDDIRMLQHILKKLWKRFNSVQVCLQYGKR